MCGSGMITGLPQQSRQPIRDDVEWRTPAVSEGLNLEAAVCRGDGSCVVSVLAKGIACRTKVEKASRAERDVAIFAVSQRCCYASFRSVAEINSRVWNCVRHACESIYSCKGQGVARRWRHREVGRALSSALAYASANRQCPRPAKGSWFWRAGAKESGS
jgi:hypothetical protein